MVLVGAYQRTEFATMAETNQDQQSDGKQRVFSEEAKQRQVSHWDMDYLPTEEIEKRMAESDSEDVEASS